MDEPPVAGVPRRANYQETRARSVIGQDIATGKLCSISDMDRRTGLYILGISGMGKSWLLVNLMLQDIKRGHGLLFIDPHGNAIDDLLDRACQVKPRAIGGITHRQVVPYREERQDRNEEFIRITPCLVTAVRPDLRQMLLKQLA